jgi:hypothetical protein
MKLASDDVVDSPMISGDESHVKIAYEWIDAGITHPVPLPLSDNDEMPEKLAPGKW